jgi:beta-glucosidase
VRTAPITGSAAELRALTLLANRTSSRTSATGGPALPLRDGVRVYLEGLPETAAAPYAQVVDDPAEAEVAVVRVRLTPRTDHAEDVDRVLDLAATVPTMAVLQLDAPLPVPEFADDCAALLVDLGATAETVLEVVFGRHAPLGRLPFALPATPESAGYAEGSGLSY